MASILRKPSKGGQFKSANLSTRRGALQSDNQVGFAVIARRWAVERFFAWINRNRQLPEDFEASIESVEAFLYAASSVLMLLRLAR